MTHDRMGRSEVLMGRDYFDARGGAGVGHAGAAAGVCRAVVAPVLMLVTTLALIALRIVAEPSSAAALKAEQFFEAARVGDVATLERVSRQERIPIDLRQSGSGMTALMYAAIGRKPEAAEWLLAHGADINASVTGYGTPLTCAANGRDGTAMMKLLLAHGADPNGCACDRFTSLMQSVNWNDEAGVALLLRNGARTDVRSRYGDTALTMAKANGYDEIERMIEDADAKHRAQAGR